MTFRSHFLTVLVVLAIPATAVAVPPASNTRTDTFTGDRNGWTGSQNQVFGCDNRSQSFGPSSKRITGSSAEVGGRFTNSYEKAYYARALGGTEDYNDTLRAKGKVRVTGSKEGAVRIGFFNADQPTRSQNDSGLPNSLFLNVQEHALNRSAVAFELETTSSRGAKEQAYKIRNDGEYVPDADKDPDGDAQDPPNARQYKKNQTYSYELKYEPGPGNGRAELTLAGDKVTVDLDERIRSDNAVFNRYGTVNATALRSGQTMDAYLGDISVNGSNESDGNIASNWTSYRNRETTGTCQTYNSFDFTYRDNRVGGFMSSPDPDDLNARVARYGDSTAETLDADSPLYWAGDVNLAGLSQDFNGHIGFFGPGTRTANNGEESLRNFAGIQLKTSGSLPVQAKGIVQADDDEDYETVDDSNLLRMWPGSTFRVEFDYTPKSQSTTGRDRLCVQVDGRGWACDNLNGKYRNGSKLSLTTFGLFSGLQSYQGRAHIFLDNVTWSNRD